MRLNNFAYLCKEGARNLVVNKLMTFACIGVLVACLLLIGGAAMFSLNVNSIVTYVEQQNEVTAFIDENMQKEDIEVLTLTLENMENILQITYVSKTEALDQLKQRVDQDGKYIGLFDGLEDDTLLDTYIIRIKDLSKLEDTVARLRETDGIVQVNASTDVANILTGLKQTVNVAGAIVVLILIVVSVAIITNTIKLTVYSRRKEINIMKYVGATDGFIRLPFLVEGMLIGLIAAIFAFFILGFGYTYLLQWAGEHYGDQISIIITNAIDFWGIALYVLAAFGGLGIFIGIVGSGVFVRKHLKV